MDDLVERTNERLGGVTSKRMKGDNLAILLCFEVHNVDCWPNDMPGAVQHNAWWDAMALRHRLAAIRERT